MLVGAFLRFYQLEYKSLWVDEIGQVVAAQGGVLGAIQGAALHVAAPPLDYLVTWFALQVGNNEFILRFAPAGWSLLAIALAYALAKRLTRSARISLAAAYLMALAPLVVRYAQEVRFYSLSILLTLACVYGFVRAWEQPTRARWAWLAVGLVAAFYTHYYIVFVVAAMVSWAVMVGGTNPRQAHEERTGRMRILGLGGVLAVSGACAAPWLIYAGRGAESEFVPAFPSLREILSDPVVGVNIDREWRAWLDGLGMVVLPLCAVIGVIWLWRTRRSAAILLLLILGIGVGGVLGGDFLAGYFYTPRQLLFFVPYYLILSAAGIAGLNRWLWKGRRIAAGVTMAAVLAGMTILLGVSLDRYYDWVKDDWRSAARLLEKGHAQRIVTEPDSLATYLVYYGPGLRKAFQSGSNERMWVVTLDAPPRALEQTGWNAVRLDVSPTLKVYYAGDVSETELWREAGKMELPPQTVIYSDVLARVQEVDPALGQTLAEREWQAMQLVEPPLLDEQKTRLLRRLGRLR